MIDKLVVGKAYSLVGDDSYGVVQGEFVIQPTDCEYFGLVRDYTNLQQINSPFGELDTQNKKDLLCAWVDGAEIERKQYFGEKWQNEHTPLWTEIFSYRVKPPISAKEEANALAKAKLISEAQQQLRDAQEALDKAQQL